jgi:hypothetical protein
MLRWGITSSKQNKENKEYTSQNGQQIWLKMKREGMLIHQESSIFKVVL